LRKIVFHNTYKPFAKEIETFVSNFNSSGKLLGDGERNKIKLFQLNSKTINIKSFKVPNIINQIAYKFFRKSKAQRSFEYANILTKLRIGTPQPIAYYEFTLPFLFRKSFYISEHLDFDLTYRELTRDFNYPNHEAILRAFTRFTYKLHENNVLFLDHSPGNTLIKKTDDGYDFFLVDLNRMEFKPLDFEARIKNFSRLTIHEFMVKIMSDEYAKCIGEDVEKVFSLMWKYTQEFQEKYHHKRRLKKKIKFWKKKK
jgi:hypothetical protein